MHRNIAYPASYKGHVSKARMRATRSLQSLLAPTAIPDVEIKDLSCTMKCGENYILQKTTGTRRQ